MSEEHLKKFESRDLSAIIRRSGLCSAHNSAHNKEAHFEGTFERLLSLPVKTSPIDDRITATDDLFKMMSEFVSDECKKAMLEQKTALQVLSGIRNTLFKNSINREAAHQTNPEKGAYAALYLEAAIELSRGTDAIPVGLAKLELAAAFNKRNGGAETSEVYGEVVGVVSNNLIRELLIYAMRRDTVGREAFSQILRIQLNGKLAAARQEMPSVLLAPLETREDTIQEYFSKLLRSASH